MYSCCSGIGAYHSNISKFNVETELTDKGIKLHLMPKDESKVQSFQKFVEACNEYCEDGDCC